MSRSPFVVPEGAQLAISSEELTLSYPGDIVLGSTLGQTFAVIEAEGDLVVNVEAELGRLSAGGRLVAGGSIEAEHIHGRYVVLDGAEVKAKAISATHSIRIGAARLAVDAIVAPHIEIDDGATGRVTVIESHNERRTTKIKGGFSLDEYEELFGDAEVFLRERGLSRLGDAPPDDELVIPNAPIPPYPIPPYPVPDDAEARPMEELDVEEEDEDVDDPLSLSIEDLEPVVELDHELHPQLVDALRRINLCYDGTEKPPAVDLLRDLVNEGDYDKLRGNITDVWNGLLSYHQKRGIRPHHQVTHAFNVIHGLVQEL